MLPGVAMETRRQPHDSSRAAESHWFALYTRSHHEKAVAKRLADGAIEHFLPLYHSTRAWSCNRKVNISLPLFPNYIFVHITPSERLRTISTPGVLAIVGSSNSLSTIDDDEIEQLKKYIPLADFQPHPRVCVGARVRISAGPLTGMEGTFLSEANSARVVLAVHSIGQGVSVEIRADQILTVN